MELVTPSAGVGNVGEAVHREDTVETLFARITIGADLGDAWHASVATLIAEAAASSDAATLELLVAKMRTLRGRLLDDSHSAERLTGTLDIAILLQRSVVATNVSAVAPNSHAGRLLQAVIDSPGRTSGELAERLGLSISELSRTGGRLVRDGLVIRRAVGKLRLWNPTPKGRGVGREPSLQERGSPLEAETLGGPLSMSVGAGLRKESFCLTREELVVQTLRRQSMTAVSIAKRLKLDVDVVGHLLQGLRRHKRVLEDNSHGRHLFAFQPTYLRVLNIGGIKPAETPDKVGLRSTFDGDEVLAQVQRLRVRGELFKAREELRQALSGPAQAQYEPTDWRLVRLWSELGLVQRNLGRYLQAVRTQESACKWIGLGDASAKESERRASVVFTNAGVAYCDIGEYKKARKRLLFALKLKESSFGQSHVETARTRGRLGLVSQYLGEYDEALAAFRAALKSETRNRTPVRYEIAKAQSNLGFTLWHDGQVESAIEHLVGALDLVSREELAGGLPAAGVVNGKLAIVLPDSDDWVGAERHARLAVGIRREILSLDHPEYATSLTVLGGLLADQERVAEAAAYIHQAIRILIDTVGPSHPHMAIAWSCLSSIEFQSGRNEASVSYAALAEAVLRKRFGGRHPTTRAAAARFAIVRGDQRVPSEARKLRLVAA